MPVIVSIIIYSFISGVTVFIGGLLSRSFEAKIPEGVKKEEFIHASIAFGGGIIIAAVAFVLVPRGMAQLRLLPLLVTFLGGAVLFFLLDRAIERKGGSTAQILAMLMDFVPEAIALGAVFAHDVRLGLLLALFIGLQNLPEAFNSYRDLISSGFSPRSCLLIMFGLSFSGVAAALLGYYLLGDAQSLIAGLMVFASGGILYLVFQDIAPSAKLSRHWMPALGACLGFTVGMVGQKLLG